MNLTLSPGPRAGSVRIPPSKSQAHRLFICAALGEAPVRIGCGGISKDIAATVRCLNALGASVEEAGDGTFRVEPVRRVPDGVCALPCGESGSTLRFLLPVAGALGARSAFLREGRLPQRPLAPLDALLARRGMTLREDGAALLCGGRLRAGEYAIAGNVSSQYISGLLLALPLLCGDSTLSVTGALESADYVAMTEKTLQLSNISFDKTDNSYFIRGKQLFRLPERVNVEGDWSNAAFFLCMGALSDGGVTVEGLTLASAQGDRAVLGLLRRFGAAVETGGTAVTVRRGNLRGCEIDASPVPDLIPALCAVAAAAEGQTRIVNAARLRFKESDRLATTARLLCGLGADAAETADGLVIRGRPSLAGGTVDAANDHRIAMAAAVAACACESAVTVGGAECVSKSYPAFWEDFLCLSM